MNHFSGTSTDSVFLDTPHSQKGDPDNILPILADRVHQIDQAHFYLWWKSMIIWYHVGAAELGIALCKNNVSGQKVKILNRSEEGRLN